MEALAASRIAPEPGRKQEEVEATVGITRPLARRGHPLSTSPPDEKGAAHSSPGGRKSASGSQPAAQRMSAWTKYQSPASSSSPQPTETIAPPPDTAETRATQAAAQQMWEQATAAPGPAPRPTDSDNTHTTTSGSPPDPAPPTPRTALDASILQTMLNNLQGGGLNTLQAMQIQEAYINSLKSAYSSVGAKGGTASSNPQPSGLEPPTSRAHADSGHFSKSLRLPEGILSRPKAERVNGHAANGSLSILPEPSHRSTDGRVGFPEPLPARLPPTSPFNPPPGPSQPLSQLAGMTPQQVVKLLEDALRAQGPSQSQAPPFQQHSLPAEIPGHAMMGMNPLAYPSFARYASQEPSYREPSQGMYSGTPLDLDPGKMATRRWNSCASMMSDNSLFNPPSASFGPTPHSLLGSIPPNLSGPESQAFLQALQQRFQAHEMEAAANAKIQQILAGSSERSSVADSRKRKLPAYYDEQPRRHASMMVEGENYYSHPQIVGGPQQVCTECGTTNTPTWRRSGKRLMCNACGLRRSRSVRSARCNSMGPATTLRQEPPTAATSPKLM